MRTGMIVLGLVILAGVLLAGCDGSGGNTMTATGGARFTIRWPQPSRMIPVMTQSLELWLASSAGGDAIQQFINRPVDQGSTTLVIDGLPPGVAFIEVRAYSQVEGQGEILAEARTQTTIVAGEQASVVLALNSTVDRLVLTPAAVQLAQGRSQSLLLTAYGIGAEVIPVSPSMLRWSSSNPAIARVEQNGIVTAVSPGAATITVTDLESSITGAAQITVPSGHGP